MNIVHILQVNCSHPGGKSMQYHRLGNSGLQLSVFSYGSWVTFGRTIDARAAVETMALAYDAGVNFFDNAEGYAWGQSELIMGDAQRRLGWSRDSYCVSSKVMFGSAFRPGPLQRGLSRKHVMEACDQALRRLGIDGIVTDAVFVEPGVLVASVDEADIGLIRAAREAKQPVEFSVDAYPDMLFEGAIEQIRLSPIVMQNVVTYPVVVSAPNPDLKLMPGMKS